MASETDRRGPGRPPAASRGTVEQVALGLMLRDGYDAVNVDMIAQAAGIGRTTFFRYFGSKPGVIWAPFDATIDGLRSAIDECSDGETIDALHRAILSSTRSALESSDVWLERFQLLDSHASLRSEAYEHWERWKQVLADRIARDTGADPRDVVPTAIAAACQGVFLAELRNWQNHDHDRVGMLERLDQSLSRVGAALRRLL